MQEREPNENANGVVQICNYFDRVIEARIGKVVKLYRVFD